MNLNFKARRIWDSWWKEQKKRKHQSSEKGIFLSTTVLSEMKKSMNDFFLLHLFIYETAM